MNFHKVLALLLLLTLTGFVAGFTKLAEIPFQGKLLTSDPLGRLYLIERGGFVQYDSLGNKLAVFSENRNGSISQLDASNPMKILVFYRDFKRLLFLDTKLAVQSSVDLPSLRIMQPLAACASASGGFWVYDQQDSQLRHIGDNLKTLHESGNLSQITGADIRPVFMTEHDNQVYLSDAKTGVLVFDAFGTYIRTLPVTGSQGIQVSGGELIYRAADGIETYDLRKLSRRKITLPGDTGVPDGIRVEKRILYLLRAGKVEVWKSN